MITLQQIKDLFKRKKTKHLHAKGAWRYDKNMKKVFCKEDEF